MERQDTVAHVRVAGSLAKWAASLIVQSSKRIAAKRAGSRAQTIRIVYTSAHHLRTSAMRSQRAPLPESGFASLAEFAREKQEHVMSLQIKK